MSYEKKPDYDRISTLLLLFNVESVRQNGEHTQWFPFDKFKFDSKGKVSWSLEHIHAQQSEGLRTQEMWKEWLSLHIPSVRSVTDDIDLPDAMQAAIDKPKLERTKFDGLQQRVIELLSVQGNAEYLHSISNLALLRSDDNAAAKRVMQKIDRDWTDMLWRYRDADSSEEDAIIDDEFLKYFRFICDVLPGRRIPARKKHG